MKVGRLSQTVWKRSVLKQLHREDPGRLIHPAIQESCAAVAAGDEISAVMASASVSGQSTEPGFYAAAAAVNDLAAKGGAPEGVFLRLLLPVSAEEEDVRQLTARTMEYCEEAEVCFLGVQAQTDPAVCQIVAVAEALGTGSLQNLRSPEEVKPGQTILLCGYVGLEGSLRILDERENELRTRFVPSFLAQTAELKSLMNGKPVADAVKVAGSLPVMLQIKSGGIFAALWDLAEAAGVGLDVSLNQMSIRQETVEICEYYRLNPYQMTSAGSFLLVTEEPEKYLKALEESGVRAERLGVTTAGNARVVTSGSELRYLDRPAPDELEQWRERERRIK